MTKLYTVRDPAILALFGWDQYMGEPRLTYPSYVTAALGLWEFWDDQRRVRDGMPPRPVASQYVEHILTGETDISLFTNSL